MFIRKKGADATIAVMEVDWDEASRFGIMNADEDGRIVEFEEKPANQNLTFLLWEFTSSIGKFLEEN